MTRAGRSRPALFTTGGTMKHHMGRIIGVGLFLATAGCAGTPATPDRVEDRDGVVYELSTDAPFTGVLETPYPDSDRLLARTRYRDGLKHGVSEGFDEDGRRVVQEEFVEGERHGDRLEWWENGQLKRRQTFAGGELNGLVEEWNPEGQRVLKELYEDGKRQGRVVAWYDNGQIKSEASYDAGALQGVLRQWYPDDQQKAEKSFRSGYAHGPHTEWHENGALRLRMQWSRGKPEGNFTRWYENGQVQAEGHYLGGEVGSLRMYAEDGTPLDVAAGAGAGGSGS